MEISALSVDQWVSVGKNAVIAGAVAFVATLQATGDLSSKSLYAAAIAAGVAVVKFVEKLLEPVK